MNLIKKNKEHMTGIVGLSPLENGDKATVWTIKDT